MQTRGVTGKSPPDGAVTAKSNLIRPIVDKAEKKTHPMEHYGPGLASDRMAWTNRVLEKAVHPNCMKKGYYRSRCSQPLTTNSVCDEKHNSKRDECVVEKRAAASQRRGRGGRGRSKARSDSPVVRMDVADKRPKMGESRSQRHEEVPRAVALWGLGVCR